MAQPFSTNDDDDDEMAEYQWAGNVALGLLGLVLAVYVLSDILWLQALLLLASAFILFDAGALKGSRGWPWS